MWWASFTRIVYKSTPFIPITSVALTLPFKMNQRNLDTIGDEFKSMAPPLSSHEELMKQSPLMRHRMEKLCLSLQEAFCRKLEQIEAEYGNYETDSQGPLKFRSDRWERQEGGGGITCILEEGQIFERAGVNISVVHGRLPPPARAQMKSRGRELIPIPGEGDPEFYAVGISSVIHPRNPNVPTIHFNFRYFEVTSWNPETKQNIHSWWFGGGLDLTPYILYEDDAKHFHVTLKNACDQIDGTYYPKFKKWCDEYFYISHRGERRGVGGLFFDDIDHPNAEDAFSFIKSCANAVIPCYTPIVLKRLDGSYSLADRDWQLLRRGRYVEFNLVYDRGTKFGLFTPGARFESILVSLPVTAKWAYCHTPAEGTKEHKLLQVLKTPREWV